MGDVPKKEKGSGLIGFANLSLYLGVVVLLSIGSSYWIGRRLDEHFNLNYVFTIVFLIAGSGMAFYVIVRRLMDIGKGQDKTRR